MTASIDRSESYVRVTDGQVRCITPDFKPKDLPVAWNNVFVPAWMVPPIYHSLHKESVKNANSNPMGIKSVRPTWFEDPTIPKGPVSHRFVARTPGANARPQTYDQRGCITLARTTSFPCVARTCSPRNAGPRDMELQADTNQFQGLD